MQLEWYEYNTDNFDLMVSDSWQRIVECYFYEDDKNNSVAYYLSIKSIEFKSKNEMFEAVCEAFGVEQPSF